MMGQVRSFFRPNLFRGLVKNIGARKGENPKVGVQMMGQIESFFRPNLFKGWVKYTASSKEKSESRRLSG